MSVNDIIRRTLSPVETDEPHDRKGVQEGIALCLSGGGYRAMLFHVGALWRLNELGFLTQLKRISSVSGGSITAGLLGLQWSALAFGPNGVAANFASVTASVRKLAGRTIDQGAILGGLFGPGSIADKVVAALDEHLFKGATLQAFPDEPRFVINATNVQSGALWRFMKPAMRDWRVGEVKHPQLPLAVAVTASAAFPPFLSPMKLELDPASFNPGSGDDLQREPYTSDVYLTDGGVYDNLGLETAWKRYSTILVSNGGGKMSPEAEPKGDWARHSKRVLDLIDNQVRSLRQRQVIGSFQAGLRQGTYWGIRTNIADYRLPVTLPCPLDLSMQLANIDTRLKRLEPDVQERLINWGYAVCDAAMRRHVVPAATPPAGFPYPQGI